MPRRIRLDERAIEVAEVLDQWFGADYRYCKIRGDDGALYILQLDEKPFAWSLWGIISLLTRAYWSLTAKKSEITLGKQATDEVIQTHQRGSDRRMRSPRRSSRKIISWSSIFRAAATRIFLRSPIIWAAWRRRACRSAHNSTKPDSDCVFTKNV
jgi:hypothetical protein